VSEQIVSELIVIDPSCNGFPRLAHGGYVSGVVAGLIGKAATVTLRSPPPMGRPLAVRRGENGVVSLVDVGRVIVKGVPSEVGLEAPAPPEFEESERAAGRFPSGSSPSPTCLCCGHLRPEGEGLRIFPGPIPDREMVAAPWMPHPAFGDPHGLVRPEFVWAALDCPGAWGLRLRYEPASRSLTVRMGAQVFETVAVGEPHVVIGWPIERRRRLLECGSALFGSDGRLKAIAHAIWMRTPDGRMPGEAGAALADAGGPIDAPSGYSSGRYRSSS